MTRDRLPNRRLSQTVEFERDGSQYRVTAGYYPDGRVAELFLNADRGESLLDVLVADAAIAISLCLQHGCALETIAHALKRDKLGLASSPIGAAIDRISGPAVLK
jgi:hypothetical protein